MEEEGREGAIAYVCTTGLCHFVVVLWRDSEKGCALRVGNGGGGTISRACGIHRDTKSTFQATYLLRQSLVVPELGVAPLNPQLPEDLVHHAAAAALFFS